MRFKQHLGRPKSSFKNMVKVNALISAFNTKNTLLLNTALDGAPHLTEEEFSIAQAKALECGYGLSKYEDNYNTITYKLSYL